MKGNFLSHINIDALNSSELNSFLSSGWDLTSTGASIGDNPSFRLVQQNFIQETNFDRQFHQNEL